MKIKNYHGIIEWIFANTKIKNIADVEKAVLWFAAMQISMDLTNSNSAKDWAHLVLNGMPALNFESVDAWIKVYNQNRDKELNETGDENHERVPLSIEKLLEIHFEVEQSASLPCH